MNASAVEAIASVVAVIISLISLAVVLTEKVAGRHRLTATLEPVTWADGRGNAFLLRLLVTSENRSCTVESFDLTWRDWVAGRPGTGISYGFESVDSSNLGRSHDEVLATARFTDPVEPWRRHLADGETGSWVVEPTTNDPDFGSRPQEVRALIRTRSRKLLGSKTKIAYSNAALVQLRLTSS